MLIHNSLLDEWIDYVERLACNGKIPYPMQLVLVDDEPGCKHSVLLHRNSSSKDFSVEANGGLYSPY